MKKGFTIAETVITMAILGVIAAIVIPSMQNAQPNKDIVMYNKAIYTLQSAVGHVMDHTFEIAMEDGVANYRPELFLKNISRQRVCEELAASLNTKGEIKCDHYGSFTEPNFITSDGLRFWDIGHHDGSFFAGNDENDLSEWAYVDYDLTNADRQRRAKETGDDSWVTDKKKYGLKLAINIDGKVYTENNNQFIYENKLIENGMDLKIK